jgi:hypothetical protein
MQLLCGPVLHQALNETVDVAVSGTKRPEFIRRDQPQQRCQLNLIRLCVTTIVNKDYKGFWRKQLGSFNS